MSEVSIYIATTKECALPYDRVYHPIEVGFLLHKEHLLSGYANDAEGQNISNKNASFCELTALFWMWKNSSADIIGLVHYRRYLSLRRHAKKPNDAINSVDIEQLMKQYDFIVPHKQCIFGSVRKQYMVGQNIKDYDLVGEIIKKKYPDYYDAFQAVSEQEDIYICNIFIGKRNNVNEYCAWLFDILFELERRIDISDYSKQQKRVFGYLGERLFNVWLYKNQVKVYEAYMFNTEQKWIDRIRHFIHIVEYKALKIDYLKYSYKRRLKRERNEAEIN